MNAADRKLFEEAAQKGWLVWVENSAVEILSMEESRRVRKELCKRNEPDKIMQPRFVLTDKHAGLRTASHTLPVKPSARLIVPGFRDRANLDGHLRRDAPTGSRLDQHFLFCLASFHTCWSIICADIKSAFMKGDPYVSRELYITQTNWKVTPSIPLRPGQVARILKGVFGLADAPRQWWLRLSREMELGTKPH